MADIFRLSAKDFLYWTHTILDCYSKFYRLCKVFVLCTEISSIHCATLYLVQLNKPLHETNRYIYDETNDVRVCIAVFYYVL